MAKKYEKGYRGWDQPVEAKGLLHFLQENGLEHLEYQIRSLGITLEDLKMMDTDALVNIGIDDESERILLERKLQYLRINREDRYEERPSTALRGYGDYRSNRRQLPSQNYGQDVYSPLRLISPRGPIRKSIDRYEGRPSTASSVYDGYQSNSRQLHSQNYGQDVLGLKSPSGSDIPQSLGPIHDCIGRRFGGITGSNIENEMRVVLLGKTGSGKSATGNTILGTSSFHSSVSGTSVTKICSMKTETRFGKQIVIVDTPGMFDTDTSNEEIQKEIVKCISITSPGPHAFILVLGLNRFTKEEEDSVNHFVNHFGLEIYSYFIILFTRRDDLEFEGKTLEDHLQTIPENLRRILQRCGNRCIAFNNRARDNAQEEQVKKLMGMVENIIIQNGGQFYTNADYKKAEKIMKQREEAIRREIQKREVDRRRKIEMEIEEKYKNIQKEHENHLNEQRRQIESLQLQQQRLSNDLAGKDIEIENERRERRKLQDSFHERYEGHDEKKKELEQELQRLQEHKQKTEDKMKKLEKEKEEEKQKFEREAKKRQKAEEISARNIARREVVEEKGVLGHVWSAVKLAGKKVWNGAKKLFNLFS